MSDPSANIANGLSYWFFFFWWAVFHLIIPGLILNAYVSQLKANKEDVAGYLPETKKSDLRFYKFLAVGYGIILFVYHYFF